MFRLSTELFLLAMGGVLLVASVPGLPEAQRGWPHPIPCRISDDGPPDLWVMTLGDVETPLAQGVFDPSRDEVRLKDGTVIPHYFRDSLGVRYFQPIDKSRFPRPPSGWCSWYFYYQEISAADVLKNARWIAENLKDYGAVYVQIDDGWQGVGHGLGENRDWTTIDRRFSMGMDRLAQAIRELGLKPGLWLAPHGQSNPDVVKAHPGAFLLKPDGSSASDTWEGRFLVDPSTDAGHAYLRELFRRLVDWGYEYFKIDGQPIVIDEYRRKSGFFGKRGGDPVELYRQTLRTIRETIGEDRYLLGCWGIPLPGVGIMNGSRTGGDIVLGWDGFRVALEATKRWYFLHNIAWYCDPDVMVLRPPLTLDQARVWATLQGLTGQALMVSDCLPDLGPERVWILRRVFPAVDIRPLDLFPATRDKRIWDLKVSHLGRRYDVVGCFNFDETRPNGLFLRWADLGIETDSLVHVFDFWADEYLGAWEDGMYVPLAPTSCRVFALVRAEDRPQLVSTNRHITQGWVDLKALRYDPEARTYTGRSDVVRDDPYELHFAFPRSGRSYRVAGARAVLDGDELPVTIENHQGWATVRFVSPRTAEVEWEVSFAEADVYHYPVERPRRPTYRVVGLDRVELSWTSNYSLNCGYELTLDGRRLGWIPTNRVTNLKLDPTQKHRVELRAVWWDGTRSSEPSELEIDMRDQVPEEVFLSELEPEVATAGYHGVQMDHSTQGLPISVAGKRYERGIGTHAESDIVFNLYGLYRRFTAEVGVDDETGGKGSVVFEVYGDGRKLWSSGVMRGHEPARRVDIDITGVHELRLHVGNARDNIDYDHADWAEARVRK